MNRLHRPPDLLSSAAAILAGWRVAKIPDCIRLPFSGCPAVPGYDHNLRLRCEVGVRDR